ncbi:unnamed protein product, partial [Hapterophycus canaliculatus]
LAGPSRCLDAFAVTLNQACDTDDWYTTTVKLQLASLQFCVACRSVPTLHLRVDKKTPARPWSDEDATRPPWRKAAAPPAARPRGFDWRIKEVAWPGSLRRLTFGIGFHRRVDGASWPSSLEQLAFRGALNQPVDRVKWPASLQQLDLGWDFPEPLDRASWPRSLLVLNVGLDFNHSIQNMR